jgi:hypothetical protein
MGSSEMKISRREDLGNEWEANFWSDGSITLHDASGGDTIWLPADTAKRLAAIIKEAEKLAA